MSVYVVTRASQHADTSVTFDRNTSFGGVRDPRRIPPEGGGNAMTLSKLATLLFEPRTTRYVGRHRAPGSTRVVAVAAMSRQKIEVVPITD
jgi:hypothetical protein